MISTILNNALKGLAPQKDELIQLLNITDSDLREELFQTAYQIKKQNVGAVVYFRGLIEISNLCQKDCFYCGIRKSNRTVKRFRMSVEEIVSAARWAHANHYGSLVLQGGELQSDEHTAFITEALQRLHADPDYRRQLIEDGRAWYEQYHSGRVIIETFARFFERR